MAGEHTVIGFADDRWPDLQPIWDLPVVCGLRDLAHEAKNWADFAVPAMGDPAARAMAVDAARRGGLVLARVVHPQAMVSPSAHIGAGATVMAGAVVGTEVHVGDCAIVNAGAVLDHHAQVGDYAHVGLGARMGGGARLADAQTLPIGGVLGPGEVMQGTNS